MSLYRKWRPQSFNEVIGQEPIVRTLQNALKFERVAHAYLFTGPRGTGKTSLARILAKAVNCAKGESAEPCLECAPCTRIRDGYFADVLEMDAASNRGIDEIRELRDRVPYVPVEGKKKVYIIDEVHMLTTEAFNALLKILEEPPVHVIFILATTEPHKVPATITSRCQRFDFARLPSEHIVGHLKNILSSEKISATDMALWRISDVAEGSMRDALSLLDQLRNFCGEEISDLDVDTLLGSVSVGDHLRMLRVLREGSPSALFELMDSFVSKGIHLSQFLRDFLQFSRLVLGELAGVPPRGGMDDRVHSELVGVIAGLPLSAWRMSLERLSKVEGEIRWHSQPRIVIEVALLEVQQMLGDSSETSLAAPGTPTRIAAGHHPAPAYRGTRADARVAATPSPESSLARGDTRLARHDVTISEKWSMVLEQILQKNRVLGNALQEAEIVPPGNSGTLRLIFRKGYSYYIHLLEQTKNRVLVEEVLAEITGKKIIVKCEIQGVIQQLSEKKNEKTGEESKELQVTTAAGISLEDVKSLFGK